MMTLSASDLRRLLRYDPETGFLFWKTRGIEEFASEASWKSWNSQHAEKRALTTVSKFGYLRGTIKGEDYFYHKVAWAIFYGEWQPKGLEIDHINRDKLDNRISNLRLCTRLQNMLNRPKMKSKILPKGVRPDKNGKFRAMCSVNKRAKWLGAFPTVEEAAAAYDAEMIKRGEPDFIYLNLRDAG